MRDTSYQLSVLAVDYNAAPQGLQFGASVLILRRGFKLTSLQSVSHPLTASAVRRVAYDESIVCVPNYLLACSFLSTLSGAIFVINQGNNFTPPQVHKYPRCILETIKPREVSSFP